MTETVLKNLCPSFPRKLHVKFDFDTQSYKIGQGQSRFIVYINCVELESLMMQAKFQNHRTLGSEEDF